MRKETPKYWLYSDNALLQALKRKKLLRDNLVKKISIYENEIKDIEDALRKRTANHLNELYK